MNQRNKGSTLVEKKNKVEIKDVSFDCHNLKTIFEDHQSINSLDSHLHIHISDMFTP